RAEAVFARRIREERQRAGITQAALAERLGGVLDRTIDPSAVARAEKHQRTVRLDEAVAIADVLEMPLSALLRDRERVDEEIAEQRQALGEAQWRVDEARAALQQAQD